MVRDTPILPNRRTKGKKQKPGFPTKDFGNDKKRGSFLSGSIAPYSSPRQSLSRGPQYLKKPKKRQKRGFPTKDFGNDGGGSFLNGSITLRSSPRQSSSRGPWFLKASGFPTKDFGNDGGGSFLSGSSRDP